MARPLWSGAISFGLLHIPVNLMPGERRVDLRFHMVDSRDNARIRYERVNAETGEEVPWKNIVKAFEYEKGSYVVLKDEDFKNAAPESSESIDIESFIDADAIGPEYLERPYYVIPGKKAEKGYVLLRETLKKENKAGLARVVIRTREHLALLLARDEALQLILLRFPQEVIEADEYTFPSGSGKQKISAKETEMASQLVQSMTAKWTPKAHKDDYREKLSHAIKARIKRAGAKVKKPEPETHAELESSDKVVDFMALLKKSIASNKRTPAASRAHAAKPARRRGGKRRKAS